MSGPSHASPLLLEDLDLAVRQTEEIWERLNGAEIFITGGTSFFGRWLLEVLTWAVDHQPVRIKAAVLTRQAEAFARQAPHLARHPAITLVEGNVRDFSLAAVRQVLPRLSHIIHAANESGPAGRTIPDEEVIATATAGTNRVLELISAPGGTVRRLLYTSSGAVYGPQPPALERVTEEWREDPHCPPPSGAYGESKRRAEALCLAAAGASGYEAVIARGFAFMGPYLPLDLNFAAGNFLRDALAGGPVQVGGDGRAVRSYLYAADLSVWLWTMLVRGQAGRAYNVGSPTACTIRELADQIAALASAPPLPVHIAQIAAATAGPAPRYVPDTRRAELELNLAPTYTWQESCARTLAWHRLNRTQATS